MPRKHIKSIREMTKWERSRNSMAGRSFRVTMMGQAILGIVALIIGMGLYSYALMGQCIGEAFTLARSSAAIISDTMEPEKLAGAVMTLYHDMTPEERETIGTDAYRARFSYLENREDYQFLMAILQEFYRSSDVDDIYVAMYDRDTSAVVYIADPAEEEETGCSMGDWDRVSVKEVEKFLTWDGEGRVYNVSNTPQYGWLCTSGVPLTDAAGETVCFVMADIAMRDVVHGLVSFLLQFVIALVIVIFLLTYILIARMKKTLVQPINDIAEAAQNYARDKKAGLSATDHFSALNIHTGDEIENLSLIMADMERDLTDFESNLTRVTAEKERIGTELALATRIQAHMLPNIFPAFPERTEFDIYASMTPAKEVGGDFYDFFLIDDDRLALVMADVSGKGVPAALFMMASKILVKNYAMSGLSPSEVLNAVNAQICANNREEMFVTVWLGILDIASGKLTAANAGHEYPVLKQPDGSFELVKDRHGFVIGGLAEARYSDYDLQMAPGAKLFLYTDGVAEATDESEELFGIQRMLEALRSAEDGAPNEILQTVDEAVGRFVGRVLQFDDVTMMCIHYIGKNATEGGTFVKEMTVEATVENIEAVTEFVNAELEALNCPLKAQMQIDVAIDELFGNIAHYAYHPETGPATVRVEVEQEPLAVIITFIDNGVPYDPLATEEPDVTLSAEERKIGGLGVFLVKKTMDDVSYEYKNGQNILRIRKNM